MYSKLLLCVVTMTQWHLLLRPCTVSRQCHIIRDVWGGGDIVWRVVVGHSVGGRVGGSGKAWGGGNFIAAICGIRPTKQPSKNWGNSSGWSSCLISYYLLSLIVSVPAYSSRQHGYSPTLPLAHLTRPELWWRLKQCQYLSSSFPQQTWV